MDDYCPNCGRLITSPSGCPCSPNTAPMQHPQGVAPVYPQPGYGPPVDIAEQRRRETNRTLGIVAGAIFLVVSLAVAAVLVYRATSSTSTEPAALNQSRPPTSAQVAPGYVPVPSEPRSGTTVRPPTVRAPTVRPTTPTAQVSAEQQLKQYANSDLPGLRVDANEMWVPQLSSKRPGTKVDNVSYDEEMILSDHLILRAAYPGTTLVWSGDWTSFKSPDYWVTVAGGRFGTADEANRWCDAQAIPKDDCFAKRLSTTGGYEGNTKVR